MRPTTATVCSHTCLRLRPTSFSVNGLFLLLSLALLAIPCILKADLLVVDRSKDGILRFDDAGNLLGTFVASGSGGLVQVSQPIFGPDGNFYIPDQIAGKVNRYNGSTGAFMDTFVPKGTGGLVGPVSIVFGPDGNLYVADMNARVIRRYDGTTGTYIGVFTNGGNPAVINEWLTLEGPTNLIFGPDGNLYVDDAYSIIQFNGATGAYMSIFVPRSNGFIPAELVFGPDGNLYVETELTGVRKYNGATGAFISQFVPYTGVWSLGGLAFGPDGNLYVGYTQGTNVIRQYNGQTGALIKTFVPSGVIGNLQVGFVFTPGAGVLTSVHPSHGGNAGSVTVTVIGSGFTAGATVSLTGMGPAILGTNTNVPYPSALTTTFDLTGVIPGVYNIVITGPGGTSATLTGAFTVDQGGAPQISVNIVGREKIQIGSAQTYYLAITNAGSVDSASGIVSLNVPSFVTYQQASGPSLFVAGSIFNPAYQIPNSSAGTSIQSLLFVTPGVSAGSTQVAPVQLTLPSGVSNSSFTLTGAWQQDLATMSLQEFLGLQNIAFIPYPSAGCLPCLNNYSAEVSAYSNLSDAYLTFQTAQDSLNLALVNLPVAIGKTVAAAFFVTTLGVTEIGGVALSALIAQADSCAQNFFGLTTGQGCLPSLEQTLTTMNGVLKT